MNVVAKEIAGRAIASLDFGLFHDAVFKSEFAVYVVRFDPDGLPLFEEANDTVVALAGRPLAQVVGQRPVDCLPTEIGECLETRLATCFSTGEPVLYERSVEGPNGTLAFRTHLIPIIGRFGRPSHAVGITRDVSKEADQVKEAQQNATLLQRLGIALPSAIYLLNLRDNAIRFIGGDPDPDRLAWRGKAEKAGREAIKQFMHPEDHAKVKAHRRRLAALRDGEVETVEFRILTPSGDYRPHSNRETVFSRNAKGDVELVLGISEDITDRDLAERQVRDLSERLLTSQIDERRRIAEDLHDSTGQHLFAVGLALARARSSQGARGKARENRATLFEALDDARHSLQVAQREVRMLSYLLHPPEIVSEGLGEAIRNFARGFAKRSGHYVEAHVAPEADTIGDEASLNLFRACQEALTNVYRHAEASMVVIELEVDDASVRLEVTDDGVGVDPSPTLGVGLSGMRERLRRLGGDAELSGGAGGTTLLVTVPRTPI
jgi:two-component system, NarL family, sensor kinase